MPDGDNFPALHPYKLDCRDRSDIYGLDNELIIFDGNAKGFLTTQRDGGFYIQDDPVTLYLPYISFGLIEINKVSSKWN